MPRVKTPTDHKSSNTETIIQVETEEKILKKCVFIRTDTETQIKTLMKQN